MQLGIVYSINIDNKVFLTWKNLSGSQWETVSMLNPKIPKYFINTPDLLTRKVWYWSWYPSGYPHMYNFSVYWLRLQWYKCINQCGLVEWQIIPESLLVRFTSCQSGRQTGSQRSDCLVTGSVRKIAPNLRRQWFYCRSSFTFTAHWPFLSEKELRVEPCVELCVALIKIINLIKFIEN